jgi:hypothetical protein
MPKHPMAPTIQRGWGFESRFARVGVRVMGLCGTALIMTDRGAVRGLAAALRVRETGLRMVDVQITVA